MNIFRKLFGTKAKPESDTRQSKLPLTPAERASQLSPIHQAVEQGNVERVKLLLQGNPQLAGEKGPNNYTPLTWAALLGNKELVKLFLANRPASLEDDFSLALHLTKSREIAELILDHGAKTDLSSAAVSGLDMLAELLLARGSDVNVKCSNGWTPLYFAAYYNYPNIVRLLLAGNAEVNLVDDAGQTPLHSAVAYKGDQEMVELLLSKQAKVNIRDKNGRTPLHLAASEGKQGAVKVLLANGAEVNVRDNRGKTPLQLAAIAGQKAIEDILREQGGLGIVAPVTISEIELPPELIKTASNLEQRLRLAGVSTRKVPISEWSQVPQDVRDMIPNWIPTLLANFNLLGGAFEHRNINNNREWPLYFGFMSPELYAGLLFGKSRYCFEDEFVQEGLTLLSDESDGNMWLTSISGGPASPVYLFDLSGHEKILASERIDLLLEALTIRSD